MALTKVTSAGLTDDSIVNADINSSAAVALSKLATDPSNASNLASGTVPTARLGSGSASASTFLTGAQTYASAGITEADQWRVTADFSGSTNPISANWERVDSKGSGHLGTGMSESSGYWTFPSTGFWLIDAYTSMNLTSGSTTWASLSIKVTEDAASGATYTGVSTTTTSFADGSAGNYEAVHNIVILDITDTANDKFYMGFGTGNASVACKGSTYDSMTGMNFIKLADT